MWGLGFFVVDTEVQKVYSNEMSVYDAIAGAVASCKEDCFLLVIDAVNEKIVASISVNHGYYLIDIPGHKVLVIMDGNGEPFYMGEEESRAITRVIRIIDEGSTVTFSRAPKELSGDSYEQGT